MTHFDCTWSVLQNFEKTKCAKSTWMDFILFSQSFEELATCNFVSLHAICRTAPSPGSAHPGLLPLKAMFTVRKLDAFSVMFWPCKLDLVYCEFDKNTQISLNQMIDNDAKKFCYKDHCFGRTVSLVPFDSILVGPSVERKLMNLSANIAACYTQTIGAGLILVTDNCAITGNIHTSCCE